MKLLEKSRSVLLRYKLTRRIAEDNRYRIVLFTTVSLIFNIIYALYNGFLGILSQSIWLVTMCFYYSILSVMRYYAVSFERKKGLIKDVEIAMEKELSVKRASGILLMVITLALGGSVYLTQKYDLAKSYGKIIMISLAAYTFYKTILAIVNMVKVRRKNSAILTTIRNISCADALMSMLSLQTSMLVSFESDGKVDSVLMNALTGAGVCIIVFAIGLSMVISVQKIRRNDWNGKVKTY